MPGPGRGEAGGYREDMVEEFLAYALDSVHPEVRPWFPEGRVEQNLREEVQDDIEWLYNEEWADRFARNCYVRAAGTDDYKSRVVELPDGLKVVAAIRFEGLDIGKPFVDVRLQNGDAMTPAWLDDLWTALREQFAVFRPGRLRFYRPSHLPLASPGGTLAVTEDLCYFAAPLSWMSRLPLPEHYSRVRLERAASLDFFAEYERIYAQLIEERSWMEGVVLQDSREELESYKSEGTLFGVSIDDTWAGIIAAYRDTDRGISGYCVGEFVLKRGFRGRGFGPAVQRRFAGRLEETGDAVLYGTISGANAPSLRTARKCGRVDVGGYYWVAER